MGLKKISSIFRLTGNLHYFWGVPEKRNYKLLSRNRFPFTLLLIFLD